MNSTCTASPPYAHTHTHTHTHIYIYTQTHTHKGNPLRKQSNAYLQLVVWHEEPIPIQWGFLACRGEGSWVKMQVLVSLRLLDIAVRMHLQKMSGKGQTV